MARCTRLRANIALPPRLEGIEIINSTGADVYPGECSQPGAINPSRIAIDLTRQSVLRSELCEYWRFFDSGKPQRSLREVAILPENEDVFRALMQPPTHPSIFIVHIVVSTATGNRTTFVTFKLHHDQPINILHNPLLQ